MKIHLLSDLHLEFASFTPPRTDADLVVLAGDIDEGLRGLLWARMAFPGQEIVYVAGNHEYHRQYWDQLPGQLRAGAQALGIHYLEDQAITIDGVRFLGATLWTDFKVHGAEFAAEAQVACQGRLRDYKEIRVMESQNPDANGETVWRGNFLVPEMTRLRHVQSRAWLAEQLAAPFAGPTVVVTHHLPSLRLLSRDRQKFMTAAAYASDLESLMGPAKLWLHGHGHDSSDCAWRGTRTLCNPRGYPTRAAGHQNRSFNSGLIVDV